MSEDSQVPPGSNDAPPPPPEDSAPPPPPPAGAAPPPSGSAGGAESPNRTLWIVLSYLWLLALIPFLMEKDDREVQWHAKHGLVLLVAEIILWVVFQILSTVASMVLGPLACLGCFAFIFLFVAQVALHIACIVKAVNGDRLIIPGISEFADQF